MAFMTNAEAIVNLDNVADSCDNGATNPNAVLRFYDGTPPINVDTALSGNTLLAELDMSQPAFGSASDNNPGAIVTAAAISDDTDADATGDTTFCRIYDRNTSRVPRLQLTVGESGTEVIINNDSIQAGVVVRVTSLTVTQPEG